MRRTSVIVFLAVLIAAAGASPAAAQAVLPPQNVLSVTFFTQTIDHFGRIRENGRIECCGLTNVALGADVIYGVTNRLSVSAELPVVWSKYRGDKPPGGLPYSPLDECHCVNVAVQDIEIGAHYNWFRVPGTSITSGVSFSTPTHDYPYSAEAVAGFGLTEVGLSVDVGQSLDEVVPGLSVEGGFDYAIVERSLDIYHNRSNAHLGVEYRFLRHFTGHGVLFWQHTHGGLRMPQDIVPYPERHTEFHRLMSDNHVHLGGGVSYRLQRWNLSGTYLHAVKGYPTHRVRVYSFTAGRPFRFRR